MLKWNSAITLDFLVPSSVCLARNPIAISDWIKLGLYNYLIGYKWDRETKNAMISEYNPRPGLRSAALRFTSIHPAIKTSARDDVYSEEIRAHYVVKFHIVTANVPAEMSHARTRFQAAFISILLLLHTTSAIEAGDYDGSKVRSRPVLLIPGFASSQLQAWRKHTCGHAIQKNLYRNVNVGDRIWIDVARILAQGDCWVRCMKLHMENQTEVECKLRAAEGISAINELDPGFVTGPLSTIWRELVKDLVEQFEFDPDEITVAPYDWRLPPSKLQERDGYFLSLKRKIEHAYAMHNRAYGGTGGDGLVIIAHSMGNNVFRYFLAWLQHEVGRNHWQQWIDTHISAYFAVGAPLLGSSEALELLTSGVTNGLPLPQNEVRKLVITFGSILGFLPIPSIPPTSHDSDVLVSVRFPSAASTSTDASEQEALQTAEVRNYTSVDIVSGAFFKDMAEHDPLFGELELLRQRFYVNDDIVDAFAPWERPPIAKVYAVYGTSLETKYNYRYRDTDIAGHWYQVALESEAGHRQVCHKTGDATVPYHSLSWAHTWLGPRGTLVNVTRAPQSVYFSDTPITQFEAIRQGQMHHADYVHPKEHGGCYADSTEAPSSFFDGIFGGKRSMDHVTFYESSVTRDAGRNWTTSVWEIEGARHREILSSPAFLRELRTELRQVFTSQPLASKAARPPMIDSDCYWNYRQAKCEFAPFCQYRYVFGDVTLDQSCRLALPQTNASDTPPSSKTPHPLLLTDTHRNSGLTSPYDNVSRSTTRLPVRVAVAGDPAAYCLIATLAELCFPPCAYCLHPSQSTQQL